MAIDKYIDAAIAHVRHVIQDHAPTDFQLGGAARLDDVRWLAGLLGWRLPDAYLKVIAVHDGVFAGGDEVLSSDRAFQTVRIFREVWHRPNGYWPVGADGCGNYWAMNVQAQAEYPPGTVFFFDHERDCDPSVLSDVFAPHYPEFVSAIMQRTCDGSNCRWSTMRRG